MASNDGNDDTETPGREDDPLFTTAKSLLGAVAGEETAAEFADEVDKRLGDQSVTESVMGGLAAGEQINQMRQRSRQLQGEAAAQGGDPLIETRIVEREDDGRYVGTMLYVDDDTADFFEGDDSMLIRGSEGETTVPIPQGVGEIRSERTNGVLELMVRPPDYNPTAQRRLVAADQADSADECKLCFELNGQPTGPNTCHQHREDADSKALPQGSSTETTPPAGDSIDVEPIDPDTATDDGGVDQEDTDDDDE